MKLFGSVDATGSKGIDVVRDAMQKTKFNRQLLKADGVKSPKVELIINVNNVVVRNAKSKEEMHRFPLQQLSYCADDKAERRLFAFVAKEAASNNHRCYVFDSDKCAEEITLTIGQAFELAYQKFLLEKPIETLTNSNELKELKNENLTLKQRISQLEGFLAAHGLQAPPPPSSEKESMNESSNGEDIYKIGSEQGNEQYSLPGNDLLIESLSFGSQQQQQPQVPEGNSSH